MCHEIIPSIHGVSEAFSHIGFLIVDGYDEYQFDLGEEVMQGVNAHRKRSNDRWFSFDVNATNIFQNTATNDVIASPSESGTKQSRSFQRDCHSPFR